MFWAVVHHRTIDTVTAGAYEEWERQGAYARRQGAWPGLVSGVAVEAPSCAELIVARPDLFPPGVTIVAGLRDGRMIDPLTGEIDGGTFMIDASTIKAVVERLPGEIRRVLAKGPIPGANGADCRVCDALNPIWDTNDASTLIDYHQGVDLYGRDGPERGKTATCFERCKVIYRCAGWSG
jgi:hypothetical protein